MRLLLLSMLLAAAPAFSAETQGKVLWDHWFTVTVNGTDHYEYYNDHVELRKDHYFFQNKAWKQEEEYINEEQLGALAKDTPDLDPEFFNFRGTYRANETVIDGNVRDENGVRMLTVKVRKNQTDSPIVKKSIPKKVFFSAFFPLWLGKHVSELKPGKTLNFSTVLEDNLDLNFSTVQGSAQVMEADDIAKKTKTTKLKVDYQGVQTIWWIEATGSPVRIDSPSQNTLVERATRAAAEKFLGKKISH